MPFLYLKTLILGAITAVFRFGDGTSTPVFWHKPPAMHFGLAGSMNT